MQTKIQHPVSRVGRYHRNGRGNLCDTSATVHHLRCSESLFQRQGTLHILFVSHLFLQKAGLFASIRERSSILPQFTREYMPEIIPRGRTTLRIALSCRPCPWLPIRDTPSPALQESVVTGCCFASAYHGARQKGAPGGARRGLSSRALHLRDPPALRRSCLNLSVAAPSSSMWPKLTRNSF